MRVKKDEAALKIRPPRDSIEFFRSDNPDERAKKLELWNQLRSGNVVTLPKEVAQQLQGVVLENGDPIPVPELQEEKAPSEEEVEASADDSKEKPEKAAKKAKGGN